MRFTVRHTGCGGERLGFLTGFVKSPNTEIETPTAALMTQGGSVVHVTAEVLSKIFSSPQLLWVPLSNSIQLEAGVKIQGEGVATFAGLKDHFTCATLQNVSESTPPGHFELDKVPLWTKNGKKMISADRFMDVMEVFKPDIILAIADGCTTLDEGFKRINKSVDRTCNLLDTCINRYKASKQLKDSSIVGVISGSANNRKCEDCIKHILQYKDSLTGIALAGITNGEEESLKVPLEKLETIFKQVNETLPKDLFRVIEGCWNPAVVVAAIEHGWDIFDGSYPLKLTSAGHALALNFDVNQANTELCILDLNDMYYKEDFTPILVNCECLACKKYSRAYINHLLTTKEMLASVLLNIHNLHHFDQLFHHARLHIAAKTYHLFKTHITKQYERHKNEEDKRRETEVQVSTSQDAHVKKKMRVNSDDVTNNVAVNGGCS